MTAVCTQYLTLAGLRERERIRRGEDGLVKRGRLSKALHPSILPCKTAREREKDKPREVTLKNFFEKKLRKKFGGKEKTPYLCKRFPAETGAQEKIVL